MPDYVLRVEGVNFASTMLDTQDLSCIRGAGLALLYGMRRVAYLLSVQDGIKGCQTIFDGASQAAFRFQADPESARRAVASIEDALASEGKEPKSHEEIIKLAIKAPDWKEWQGAIPLAHLSFVVELVEATDASEDAVGKALDLAEARSRARQFQSLTVRLPDMSDEAHWPDEVSRVMPAVASIYMPPDSVTPLPGEPEPKPDDNAQKTKMSLSVGARRHFGRHMRQMFYRTELGGEYKGLRFTDSLQSICDQPPKDVPESIANKMAVLYFDGNKFSKIREGMEKKFGKTAALDKFSKHVQGCRKELLKKVMDALKLVREDGEEETQKRAWVYVNKGDGRALRFETLLWGGDDIVWVAPSWLAFWLAETFFSVSRTWSIDGYPLTHAAGIVLCDRKTPIRQAKAMAEELANCAKRTMDWPNVSNVLQVEVFESADLPDDGPDAHRMAIYPGLSGLLERAADDDEAGRWMASLFTIPADRISTLIDQFQSPLEDEPDRVFGLLHRLPRSQIYRLLRMAVDKKAFGGGDGDEKIKEELQKYLNNAGAGRDFDEMSLDSWQSPGPNWTTKLTRPLSIKLATTAQYWEYAAPFDGKLRPPARIRWGDAR